MFSVGALLHERGDRAPWAVNAPGCVYTHGHRHQFHVLPGPCVPSERSSGWGRGLRSNFTSCGRGKPSVAQNGSSVPLTERDGIRNLTFGVIRKTELNFERWIISPS